MKRDLVRLALVVLWLTGATLTVVLVGNLLAAFLAPRTVPGPTRTVSVPVPYPVPGPTVTSVKTVRVTVPATRSVRRVILTGWVGEMARCVISVESANWPYDGHPRPYQARRSDGGTASGAYGFIDRTWRHYDRASGQPYYSHAYLAPPAVQDSVFAYAVTHGGRSNWTDGC